MYSFLNIGEWLYSVLLYSTLSSSSSSLLCSSESEQESSEINVQDPVKEKLDFRTFKLEKYVKIFPWLYHHAVEKGYKCKTCEMFPSMVLAGGHSRDKFSKEAVKNLTDHPMRYLRGHQESEKHKKAIAQYEGEVSFDLLM